MTIINPQSGQPASHVAQGADAAAATPVGIRAIAFVVRRSLRRHLLATCVTISATAMASALVMAVFTLRDQAERAFVGGSCGFDAVLGARSSRLQLVLNVLFHLDVSPGNIPWSLYDSVRSDPRVAVAVPIAVGDNYFGYRIVGTDAQLFTEFQPRRSRKLEIRSGGRPFDSELREAVVGDVVARRTGLSVGSTFRPHHGLVFDSAAIHDDEHDEFLVVGILEPTNSPVDRVVWIPIEAVFRMSGHVLGHDDDHYEPVAGEEIPIEHKAVSALLIKLRSPQFGLDLDQEFNRGGSAATFAWPVARVLSELFDRIGWMAAVLEIVAAMVMLVAGAAILASLHNTINERRREFAIYRALGARRLTVFSIIIMESGAIAAIGAFAGFVPYIGLLASARTIIRDQTGVVLDLWSVHPALLWTPAAAILLGLIAGLIPAWKAYATDVAACLAPHS
ncbi:MAG: ABC transporter permease [Phycisphaerae bacterium]|nr:ABC transporter permease [Phycisphaerae bacterium]